MLVGEMSPYPTVVMVAMEKCIAQNHMSVFFVTYTALVTIVAINIIVSVLLENFVSTMDDFDTKARIEEEALDHHKSSGAFDNLLATLANFTSPQHLKEQLDLIFTLWDVDDNGTIDFHEMQKGAQMLGYDPPVIISTEDWDVFTFEGLLLNEDQSLDRANFELAMRFQLSDYGQRLLANKMQRCIRSGNEYAPVLFVLKLGIMELMASAADRWQSALQKESESARKSAGGHKPATQLGSFSLKKEPNEEGPQTELMAWMEKMFNSLQKDVQDVKSRLDAQHMEIQHLFDSLSNPPDVEKHSNGCSETGGPGSAGSADAVVDLDSVDIASDGRGLSGDMMHFSA